MKTPEEYLDEIDFITNLDGIYEEIKDVVNQIQKNTYNQALEDAVENVIFKRYASVQQIKGDYVMTPEGLIYHIEPESILKLKIK